MLRFGRIFAIVFVEALFWFTAGFGLGGLAYLHLAGYIVNWEAYWTAVIGASAMGGLALALMVGLADAFFCAQLRVQHGITNPRLRPEEVVELRGDVDDARALVKKALAQLGARIKEDDEEEGVIVARKGFSFKTVGERITVRIEDAGPDAVRVILKSEPRFRTGFVDFGQNARNVARLAALLRT